MGTYITPTIVAKEALIALENNMVFAGLVHRDYSKEFQKVGSTVVIRKPLSFTASAVSDTVHMNTPTESSVTVILNQHLDVSFEVTSQELGLQIVDFSEQLIQPAMRAVAATVDKLLADLYKDVYGHYAVSATPVVSDITNAGAVLDVMQAPLTDRRLVLHPVTKADYMSLTSFLEADHRGDGGRALRTAEIGNVLGFDTYMDQNIRTHTQPISDAAGVNAQTLSAGATSSSVTGITASGTILADDVFKITGYDEWFVVAKNATADSGGSVTISFDPVLQATSIADGKVLTFQKTHRANLAFHKNAFALVTAPLAPPIGGAASAVLSYKGLSCRVCYDYTMLSKKNMVSIDFLCGVKTLDAHLACRLADTR